MWRAIRAWVVTVLAFAWVLSPAQTVYGVGDASGGGTTYNRLFSVNPTTGVATNLCALSFQSAAMAVSPVDGLVYYFEYNVANPDLNTINPTGCVNGTARPTTLPTGVIRATFCPDGRLYASSSTLQFYELNPATGATLRTINITGMPAGGSGDFVCVNNGDFYVVANTTNGSAGYSLFRAAGSTMASAANGGSVAFTNVGPLNLAGTPNGLTEITQNLASCAAAPNPCLIASTGTTNRVWGIDVLNGDADQLPNNTGHTLADLSRSYPLDVSIAKSVSPTVVLQGQTAYYTLTVTNEGPAVAKTVTVTDVLSPALYDNVAWTCTVTDAGSSTSVATACGTASGTGSLNQVVSLSIGGAIRFDIAASVADNFTGVISNAATATISVLLTELDASNNRSTTASATVTPAAKLSVLKSDNASTAVSGTTITYTIKVINEGPAAAPGTVMRDPPAAGLDCYALDFTAEPAGAATAPGATVGGLQSSGITITPTFNAGSTATFELTCRVSATGE